MHGLKVGFGKRGTRASDTNTTDGTPDMSVSGFGERARGRDDESWKA
jgi:hypothetical protein